MCSFLLHVGAGHVGKGPVSTNYLVFTNIDILKREKIKPRGGVGSSSKGTLPFRRVENPILMDLPINILVILPY